MKYLKNNENINESSGFIILLATWFLYDSLRKIPKENWPQYIMENTKEMFSDFVGFLSKYGYTIDKEVLRDKIDNIFRLALGKLYKEGGIIDYETGKLKESMKHLKRFSEINESLPRQHTVDQLKRLRKLTKGTDIGDRISDMNKEGANIQYIQNPIDSGIESYEDYEKANKKFIPSWNLKHLSGPFGKKVTKIKQ